MQCKSYKGIVMAAVLAASPAFGQATQPAEPELETLTVAVWTCLQHDKFRMAGKGVCPECEAALTRRDITVQSARTTGSPYPLATCPVSGMVLGSMGPAIAMMHEGREVRFCGAGCIKKFEAGASKYFEQIDKEIIEQQLPYYPMTSCPVSGEPLGSMGEPVNYVHNNRLVRFCCKGCLRGFKKDPAPTLAKLNQAVIEQQRDGYPLETCLISRMALDSMGGPVDYIVANRLVRLCCGGCASVVYKTPSTYLAKLNEAWPDRDTKPSQRQGEHDHDHDHDHDH